MGPLSVIEHLHIIQENLLVNNNYSIDHKTRKNLYSLIVVYTEENRFTFLNAPFKQMFVGQDHH